VVGSFGAHPLGLEGEPTLTRWRPPLAHHNENRGGMIGMAGAEGREEARGRRGFGGTGRPRVALAAWYSPRSITLAGMRVSDPAGDHCYHGKGAVSAIDGEGRAVHIHEGGGGSPRRRWSPPGRTPARARPPPPPEVEHSGLSTLAPGAAYKDNREETLEPPGERRREWPVTWNPMALVEDAASARELPQPVQSPRVSNGEVEPSRGTCSAVFRSSRATPHFRQKVEPSGMYALPHLHTVANSAAARRGAPAG
jgi:hypothetical protein